MASEKRLEKIRNVVSKRQRGLVVVIEDVHDPHNAEAIFRTCDAFGVQNVYLIFNKERAWNPRKIGKQSSSSANKWLSFKIFTNVKDCVNELKSEGYTCVGTSLKNNSKSIFDTCLEEQKIALFVGNEHAGLSDEALDLMDYNVNVPMNGMVESLNVSVATALFLYDITRKRLVSGEDFYLEGVERRKLIEYFSTLGKRTRRER